MVNYCDCEFSLEIILSASVSTVRVVNEGLISNSSAISRGKGISASNIFLNGHKIRISGSFRDIARQINRFKAGTGVTTEIHVNKKGQERLVLKTNKSKVSIIDKSGALATYFNANKMGIGADKLIEITGANKRTTPEFVYSRSGTKQADSSLHRNLSGDNIAYLGSLNKFPDVPQILEVDEGEVPDLLPEVEEEADIGPTNEELRLIRESKIKAELLRALNEAIENVAIEVVHLLANKSKTITNKQSDLIALIQKKLVRSGLGETYLRRKGNELGVEIANAIYSKKSAFTYSTYSLTQTKINLAIASAIRTTKVNEIKDLAGAIVESFKRASYKVSSSDVRKVTGSIETGLSNNKHITFEDFYFDNKRIGKWISSEIQKRAANQKEIGKVKLVLSTRNAEILSKVISKMTKQKYQTV